MTLPLQVLPTPGHSVNQHALASTVNRFCYDRLSSLLKTLEITNTDEFIPVQVGTTHCAWLCDVTTLRTQRLCHPHQSHQPTGTSQMNRSVSSHVCFMIACALRCCRPSITHTQLSDPAADDACSCLCTLILQMLFAPSHLILLMMPAAGG